MLAAGLIILAYLSGSIPTGKIVCHLKRINIQQTGSGNTGATNVGRVLGFGPAALVGVADVCKVFLVVNLAVWCQLNNWQIALVALSGSLGHSFSLFLGFKGGKAVSTYLGSLLVIMPLVTLIWLVVWGLMVKIFRLMSLINLIMLIVFVPLLYFWADPVYAGYGFLMWLLIVYTHRANLKRLANGTELKL